MKTVLVTGSAGFIGNFVAERLLNAGHSVIGLDNLNSYYDRGLKEARLARLKGKSNFEQFRISLESRQEVLQLINDCKPDQIIHLAAQAGVRYSLDNPQSYIDSNLTGFLSILEGARIHKPNHVVFASTSSVYGLDEGQPLSEHRGSNHPVSFYAATKKANEMMAHSYSHLFGISMTGLRFFTVYGPWGRPDMALFKFADAILKDKPVPLFNHGKMTRDFTYIEDIVECVVRVAEIPATSNNDWKSELPDPASSSAPFRLLNVGNSKPTELMNFLRLLEKELGKKAILDGLPMQHGEVLETWSDSSELKKLIGYSPDTPIEEGIKNFVSWFRDYYQL